MTNVEIIESFKQKCDMRSFNIISQLGFKGDCYLELFLQELITLPYSDQHLSEIFDFNTISQDDEVYIINKALGWFQNLNTQNILLRNDHYYSAVVYELENYQIEMKVNMMTDIRSKEMFLQRKIRKIESRKNCADTSKGDDEEKKDSAQNRLNFLLSLQRDLMRQFPKDASIPPVNNNSNLADEKLTINSFDDPTEKAVFEYLDAIDHDKGWKYTFSNSKDLKKFIQILSSALKKEELVACYTKIDINRGAKTRTIRMLREIQNKLSDANHRNKDYKFFEAIRVLEPYCNSNDSEIYTAMNK